MTDGFDYNAFLERFGKQPASCDPTRSICAFGVMGPAPMDGPAINFDAHHDVELPDIDFADRAWRDHCLSGKEVIPAGYTYFGQLIGHDLGRSIHIEEVPYTEKPRTVQVGPPDEYAIKRYNAIENPLTLETIYGPGPAMLPHLYDQNTKLFRINSGSLISLPLSAKDPQMRALYDKRNRDTHILHRMAAAIMKFHNRVALQIISEFRTREKQPKNLHMLAYRLARVHVLDVWHRIIKEDFLAQFIHPEVAQMSDEEIISFPRLDETSVLHGLFRAFHALPRRKYRFPELRELKKLLVKPSSDENDLQRWGLDWSLFFDSAQDGTRTGLCAAFAPEFAPPGGVKIAKLDLQTAQDTNPLHLGSDGIKTIIGQLRQEWQDQLTPEALANAFTNGCAAEMGEELTAEGVVHSPIFLVLLFEAQIYGGEGGFGPLGSVLLRRCLLDAMSKVRTHIDAPTIPELPRPGTMLDLILSTNLT